MQPWVFLLLLACAYLVFRSTTEYFRVSDPLLRELREQLSVLDDRLRDVQIYEGNKSYTVNKKRVYICLKDKNGRYYNRNMLVYVICHEYAHLLCDENHHTDKFYDIFQDLLERAAKRGLYNPSIVPLENYCGMH